MTPHLLIVDDEREIRDLLSRHFRFLGMNVDTAADGREALQSMEKQAYDVVITDIMMPGMDGIELTLELRQQYPMVKVIVMTGYVTMGNLLATIRHGADNIVFKPFHDLNEMEQSVLDAVARVQRWRDKLQQLREMRKL